MLPDALFVWVIKVTVVGSGKIPALLDVLLLLLPLIADASNSLLCILGQRWGTY